MSNDLEHNLKEQERITTEIASLQEQLTALQHDHSILLNMQQALGIAAQAGSAAVPSPRKKSAGARRSEAEKPADGKAAAKKPAAPKATSEPAPPTLIELVRRHLAEQSEPRSAAEVTEALGQAHPDRGVQTKVVRTTLENLVARNLAHRSKQGSSVFYTVPGESTRKKPEGTDTAE
ncbi:hypothetical protein ACIGXF_13705 [Streptomyces sp. NPDC053086]|uniref:hypothetical protein n=1 Tax=unclassified Streptomyces TaxID=2593676 RepID=UPI0037CDE33F